MAFNGSGVFSLVAGNPVITGTTISVTWANNTLSDIATGLSTTLTKDGQSTPTANIPMAGFKITGLGAATLDGDALRYQDKTALIAAMQAQTYTAFTTGGTSTAYTLTTSPAAAALAEDQRYEVEWHTTSGLNPTLARDGLTAKNLKVYNSAGAKIAPPTGSLVAGVKDDVVYDGTDYVVLTGGKVAGGANSTITSLTGLTTPLSTAQGGTGQNTAMPFTQSETLASQTMSLGGGLTFTYSVLSGEPTCIITRIECTGADGGYSVGDKPLYNAQGDYDGSTVRGLSVTPGASSISVRVSTNALQMVRKDNGTQFALDLSKWKLFFFVAR